MVTRWTIIEVSGHTTCVQLLHKAYSMCTVIAQSIQRMLKVSSQMHALHLLTYKSIIIHLITFKQKTIHDHLMRTQQRWGQPSIYFPIGAHVNVY